MFTTFEDVQDFLDGLGLFHMDLSLNRMVAALKALHLDGSRPLPFTVQVLGTNGKGSTATFLAQLARAHGLRVGLYTSPHFVTPRERVRIFDAQTPAGSFLPEVLWPDLASRIYAVAPELTYFEFLTVLGLLAFVEAEVQFVALEAGLGGRHDATTAVPVQGVCFAPIDLDHTKVLGNSIALIAADKAAAMRENAFSVTAEQPDEAMVVLQREATAKGVTLRLAADLSPLPDAPLGLRGPHQRHNARLALAVWRIAAEQLGLAVSEPAQREALAAARLPGRFQITSPAGTDPAFILDGGHNPHGLLACEAALRDAQIQPAAMIFSCLGDKDVDSILPLVRRMAGSATIFTPTIQDNERAMVGDELAERLRALGANAEAVPRLGAALEAVQQLDTPQEQAPVLVCGSLYLLGEFFTLRPQWLSA